MRPARRVFIKRALPALIVLALVQTRVERTTTDDLRLRICEWGKQAGCSVFQSRYYFIGDNGPFFGDTFKDHAGNLAWRHGPETLSIAAGLSAALAVYGVAAGPLGRTRVFGYRGPTRCGTCGYHLADLTRPLCPECGTPI